jgi:hypothetical protein
MGGYTTLLFLAALLAALTCPYAALIAAIAALGSSVGGSASKAHAANKNRRLSRRRGKIVLGKQQGRLHQLYGSALAEKTKALETIRKGKAEALGETSRLLRTGQRRVAERERSEIGATRQRLTSRGLGSTSIAESSERRVREASDRQMDELFSSFSAQRAGLYSHFAAAEANALQDLGEFYQARFAQESATHYSPLLELMSGARSDPSAGGGTDASGIFQLIMAMFGDKE